MHTKTDGSPSCPPSASSKWTTTTLYLIGHRHDSHGLPIERAFLVFNSEVSNRHSNTPHYYYCQTLPREGHVADHNPSQFCPACPLPRSTTKPSTAIVPSPASPDPNTSSRPPYASSLIFIPISCFLLRSLLLVPSSLPRSKVDGESYLSVNYAVQHLILYSIASHPLIIVSYRPKHLFIPLGRTSTLIYW